KVKCFEIFQSFERKGQEQLMALIDSLLLADGVAHPAEVQFRGELAQLLEVDLDIELVDDAAQSKPKVAVDAPVESTPPFGDLHGCYSILKATLLQSKFFDRVEAYRKDPSLPYPLLVLLGDYIDRGLFSLNGVLRTALQLFVTAPDHVVMLRGNHEYYVEVN